MWLLLDWGNTHLKAVTLLDAQAGLDAIKATSAEQISLAAVESLLARADIEQVLLGSVRSDPDNQRIARLCQAASVPLFCAITAAYSCGLSCAYAQPRDLGVDRWLAVIAAHHDEPHSAVFDMGSAMTLDLVSPGAHLGGQIMPGYRLMYESLSLTDRVRAEAESMQPEFQLGLSTSECVAAGIDALIEGYLAHAVAKVKASHKIKRWWLCGGGGQAWIEKLQRIEPGFQVRPNLIFEGLWLNFREFERG